MSLASSSTEVNVKLPVVQLSCQRGELLSQCAESKVYYCDFYGASAVCKHRFEKKYRHPKLDAKLRDQRTIREARALVRCALLGIRVPDVYAVNRSTCEIIMECIAGRTVKEVLDDELREHTSRTAMSSSAAAPRPLPIFSVLVTQLLEGIGEVVGLLHNNNMIHGDLTTSNFLFVPPLMEAIDEAEKPHQARDGLVVIDFGLISDKTTAEDRAVDIYVLLRAFVSTHTWLEPIAEERIAAGYRRTAHSKQGEATLQRLEVVRARGRKRSMLG